MTSAAAHRAEFVRLHAACAALDAEYLRITAPLALARAEAGLEPSAEDRARIDANRTRFAQLEHARRQCLARAAALHPRLRSLFDWFGLEPTDVAGSERLALDYRPRAATYRDRVSLRLHFGVDGEPVGARVALAAALLDSPVDGAALRDLLKSVLEVVAAPVDAAVRELAVQIQLCESPAPLLRHAAAPRPATARSPLVDVLRGTRRTARERTGDAHVACTRGDETDQFVFEVRRETAPTVAGTD